MSVSRDANMEVHWPLFLRERERSQSLRLSCLVLLGVKQFGLHYGLQFGQTANSPVRIDPPFPSRSFDGGDPLLGQRLVAGAAELPRVAFDAGVAGVFGFDVQPEVVDGDLAAVDCGEELADLRGDGLAGYAGWLGSCA